jgi:hypothetical protein
LILKETASKKRAGEFRQEAAGTMHREKPKHQEAARRYGIPARGRVAAWEGFIRKKVRRVKD